MQIKRRHIDPRFKLEEINEIDWSSRFFFIDFHLTSFQPSFDSKKSFCAKKFRTDCVTLLKKSSSPAPFFCARHLSSANWNGVVQSRNWRFSCREKILWFSLTFQVLWRQSLEENETFPHWNQLDALGLRFNGWTLLFELIDELKCQRNKLILNGSAGGWFICMCATRTRFESNSIENQCNVRSAPKWCTKESQMCWI